MFRLRRGRYPRLGDERRMELMVITTPRGGTPPCGHTELTIRLGRPLRLPGGAVNGLRLAVSEHTIPRHRKGPGQLGVFRFPWPAAFAAVAAGGPRLDRARDLAALPAEQGRRRADLCLL